MRPAADQPIVSETQALEDDPKINATDSTVNVAASAIADKETESGIKPGDTKKKNKKSNRFYIHAAASPEWSFIPGRAVGPLTLNFGGGLGYTLNKKWSVQAGIYSSKKNYLAGPNDYNPKPGTYYYSLTIYSVKAFCNILEIPVTVNYQLLNNKSHGLFASAGFSSLLMDKEVYHYDYQRAGGGAGYAVHTYQTGRFHPFAGVMLAAGYQFKVTKDFSLMASPYVKLPLYGVGEGRVKLGSTGMMIGAQYQLPSLRK